MASWKDVVDHRMLMFCVNGQEPVYMNLGLDSLSPERRDSQDLIFSVLDVLRFAYVGMMHPIIAMLDSEGVDRWLMAHYTLLGVEKREDGFTQVNFELPGSPTE